MTPTQTYNSSKTQFPLFNTPYYMDDETVPHTRNAIAAILWPLSNSKKKPSLCIMLHKMIKEIKIKIA
jgi:hypothetical protein